MDSIEKEPASLLFKLFIFGIMALIPAMILELAAEGFIIKGVLSGMSPLFVSAVENFLCVALVEEGCKYFFLKKGTWRHPAFDYCFDAIVYAVVVSLGFATVENILYVFDHGATVGIMRAVTSIPGHTIFGIFMGHYYGMAKMHENRGNFPAAKSMLRQAIIIPTLLHGFYDFTASQGNMIMTIVFYAFVIILDVIAIRRIREYARQDMPLR